MKKLVVLLLTLYPLHQAYALPLPQVASATFGLVEIIVILMTLAGLYFPFLKKGSHVGFIVMGLLLAVSLAVNFHLWRSQQDAALSFDHEEVPGMLWSQQERNADSDALDEEKAHEILLSANPQYVFIDARTRAETELGSAAGFAKIRWPDLVQRYGNLLGDKTVVATCWTGMRGSEVCSRLKAMGINCKYLKGGLKAWVAKGLPIDLATGISLEMLGTAETFENSEKFLTARQTLEAQMSGVNLIDIRHPEVFAKSHLAQAVNIAFKELTIAELENRILSLPMKPVIVVCYGQVSCSEAALFGWEAKRLGFPYLGAYAGGMESLEKLKNRSTISNTSYYKQSEEYLVDLFRLATRYCPPWVLVGMAALISSMILKGAKDLSMQYFASILRRNKLKQSLRGLEHEVVQRELLLNSTTHLKAIAGSFVATCLVLIYGFVVHVIYLAWGGLHWAGLGALNQLAGIGAMSLLAASCVSMSLCSFLGQDWKSKESIMIFILLVCSITLLIKDISYITLLMLITSFVVMEIVAFYKYIKHQATKFMAHHQFTKGWISLGDAHSTIPEGTKAQRLSYLMSKGLQVPPGFVIKANELDSLPISQYHYMARCLKSYGVRSSAMNEDTTTSSHAGLHLSIVPSKALETDLHKVLESYGTKRGDEVVLVQKCIDPIYSGVAFSHHPQWGGCILIEWGKGLSGRRMEGGENCWQIVVERASGQVVYTTGGDKQMNHWSHSIFEHLVKIEEIYSFAVDIEWAVDEEGLWLLQARPQTALESLSRSGMEHDRARLLNPHFIPLQANELSMEMDGCTRLSADLIQSLWTVGSCTDKASRMALWQWKQPSHAQQAYVYAFGRLWQTQSVLMTQPNSLSWQMAVKDYGNKKEQIQARREALLQHNKMALALDWSKVEGQDWQHLWLEGMKNWREMQTYAIYFELMAQAAINRLQTKHKGFHQCLGQYSQPFQPKSMLLRADKDYELSCSRYVELGKSEQEVNSMVLGGLNTCDTKKQHHRGGKSLRLVRQLELSAELIHLREAYKHDAVQLYYFLRICLLEAQSRLGWGQEIFELELNEVLAIFDNARLHETVLARQQDKEMLPALPQVMDALDVALLGRQEVKREDSSGLVGKNTKGLFVSYPKHIIAALLKVQSQDMQSLNDLLSQRAKGHILYAPYLSPQMVNLACQYEVAALCALHGSVLSHPAVLARERAISVVVHLDLSHLNDGEVVNIKSTGELIS